MSHVHRAAQRDDVEELRRLLDDDPGLLEAEWHLGWRPLRSASVNGSLEAARFLLDRGADIDAASWSQQTALMGACAYGRVEIVRLLLARGADPSLRSVGHKETALLLAASGTPARYGADYVGVIRLLLKDGRVPVDGCDVGGRTALIAACKRGHVDRARVLLLEGGADHTMVTIEHGKEKTALVFAQQGGHHECVRLLQWFEGELERASLLRKARAIADATEIISKAPEKVGATTEAEAQKASEEAAPAYLKGRVARGHALPEVRVEGHAGKRGQGNSDEEEFVSVLKYVVHDLKEDLVVEMVEGLRYR